LEEGKTETAGKVKAGMKTMAACLEWLTLQGRKDKLMAACLKRHWAWKVKNRDIRLNCIQYENKADQTKP